ncbi:MAG: hypothetical protein LUE96_05165 [Lachnospiraceae bacterium]|nr:hypothetical protein [Lachnospiraceae bacterium]
MNIEIKNAEDITMTHTGLLPGKKGKVIHVCFERKTERGTDYAELMLPSRRVVNSKGFDEGELAQLRLYLKGEEKNIIKNAKQIDHDLLFKL